MRRFPSFLPFPAFPGARMSANKRKTNAAALYAASLKGPRRQAHACTSRTGMHAITEARVSPLRSQSRSGQAQDLAAASGLPGPNGLALMRCCPPPCSPPAPAQQCPGRRGAPHPAESKEQLPSRQPQPRPQRSTQPCALPHSRGPTPTPTRGCLRQPTRSLPRPPPALRPSPASRSPPARQHPPAACPAPRCTAGAR